jgi:arylsulfatase A-like enzyme
MSRSPCRTRSVRAAVALLPAIAALAAFGGARAETAGALDRPNIVVLMADDLDVHAFRTARRAGFLPNLSRLFEGGTEFDESFVTEALCGPSRSVYLTGLYAHNHGVIRNEGYFGGYPAFRRGHGDNNLATWMQAAGYRTAFVGKYLNGYINAAEVPSGWDRWRALVDPSTYCMYGYAMSHDGMLVRYGREDADYQTDVLAGLAVDLVRERSDAADARPLFLSLAPTAPHLEWSCYDGIRPAARWERSPRLPMPRPPSFDEDDVRDKPEWMRGLPRVDEDRAARIYDERIVALRAVDDLLGRVVQALEAAGELERTAFLFTSDNGFLLGRHRYEGKVLLYEESIRVPLLLKVPGRPGPPEVSAIALNNDLAPTIAALGGAIPGTTMDGRSLLPLLDSTPATWRRRFLVEFPPQPRWAWPDRPPGVPAFFGARTGRDDDFARLAYAETLAEDGETVTDVELYDLAPLRDPFQVDSRHAEFRYRLARRALAAEVEALKTCAGGTCQALEE